MKTKLQRVLIMGGGTGGHVFPGLAVANFLHSQGIEVHWLGTPQGLESRLVPEANYPLHTISISGLRGKGIKPLFTAPIKISAAIWQSLNVIKKINPDLVIGMGGFVSGPGGIASWLSNRPLIIHEQNAKAGLTNKMLAHIAKYVMEGFPNAFKAAQKVVSVGNPVRAEIEKIAGPELRFKARKKPYHLLVLGGSLGAQSLNKIMPGAMAKLALDERPEILHQTGERHFIETKNLYESMHIEANLKPFIQDMKSAYEWADVVVCRAGALTVAELCMVGLGAILIPFPYAVDDHQTANANFMVQNKAAICIQQSELTESRLADIVRELFQVPEKYAAMGAAAYQLRKVNVVKDILKICQEVCR